MKVFITGGTGLVGRPTVLRLLQRGHTVLLLVRNPRKAAEIFGKVKRLVFVKGNLSSPPSWKPKVKKFRPDVCIHLAWEGIPDYGVDTSIKNLEYGLNLFYILAEAKCKKIVATGSCLEYGAATGKLSEDAELNPTTSYGAAKIATNWLGRDVAKNAGMEFCWARLFFVYGPGQKPPSLIPYLIASKNMGDRPKLKRPLDGRDFIYVENVARALTRIAESRGRNHYAAYNIGMGKLTSNARMANLIYGKKVLSEPRKPKGFWADISKIKKEIGWRPTICLKEGVKRTLGHFTIN